LHVVLKIFYRVSLPSESDDDAFPLDFYKDLVHDNWLIDVAKLFDLAAIYGQSNQETVTAIIANVFENDKRFISEFKESIDAILSMFKRSFTAS
jgi:hypothetical protein